MVEEYFDIRYNIIHFGLGAKDAKSTSEEERKYYYAEALKSLGRKHELGTRWKRLI